MTNYLLFLKIISSIHGAEITTHPEECSWLSVKSWMPRPSASGAMTKAVGVFGCDMKWFFSVINGTKDSDVTCLYGKTYNVCLGKKWWFPSQKRIGPIFVLSHKLNHRQSFSRQLDTKVYSTSDRWIFFGTLGCNNVINLHLAQNVQNSAGSRRFFFCPLHGISLDEAT